MPEAAFPLHIVANNPSFSAKKRTSILEVLNFSVANAKNVNMNVLRRRQIILNLRDYYENTGFETSRQGSKMLDRVWLFRSFITKL